MRILVTGCLGFIGSTTTEFLAESHDVYGLDDESNSCVDWRSLPLAAELHGDVSKEAWADRCSIVVHTA